LPHINSDDLEEERRVAYVGLTRAKRLLGMTFANKRFGYTSNPSQFLHELAGNERHRYIWTDAQENGADERLPLLSNRERQRLIEGPLPKQTAAPSPKMASGPHSSLLRKPERQGSWPSRNRHAGPPDMEQAQMERNNAAGAPRRHGLSWGVEEDDRLRASFEAGDAIAAIASAHKRKISAINARLIRLGLISEDGVVEAG